MEIFLNILYILVFASYVYIGTKFIGRSSQSWNWYIYIFEFCLVLLWPIIAILVALFDNKDKL